jgi:hypothetical protein
MHSLPKKPSLDNVRLSVTMRDLDPAKRGNLGLRKLYEHNVDVTILLVNTLLRRLGTSTTVCGNAG